MEQVSERRLSVGAYLATWVVLLALTGLTWGLAHLDLGGANTAVAMGIAFTKGTLIAVVFMHLIRPDLVHRFILVASLLFVGLLMSMVLLEAQTRFPLATPPASTRFNDPIEGQLG